MMQVDGLALLTASLNNWMHRGPQCPHLLMSTCFHSLIQLGLISDSPLLDLLVPQKHAMTRISFFFSWTIPITVISRLIYQLCSFGFGLQTLETAIEGEELVFLYQVKRGICQSSCAANIATLASIPDDLVKRGVEVWFFSFFILNSNVGYSYCYLL